MSVERVPPPTGTVADQLAAHKARLAKTVQGRGSTQEVLNIITDQLTALSQAVVLLVELEQARLPAPRPQPMPTRRRKVPRASPPVGLK